MKNQFIQVKTTYFLGLISAILLTFSSCEKETPGIYNDHIIVAGDYLNKVSGNYWEYTTITEKDTSKWEIEVLDSTTNFRLNQYAYFQKTLNGSKSLNYYAYQSCNYYSLIKDGNGSLQELIYFKDSLSIGDKWSQKIIGNGGITLTYNFETINTDYLYTGKYANGSSVQVRLTIPEINYICDSYYMHWYGLVGMTETNNGIISKTDLSSYMLADNF